MVCCEDSFIGVALCFALWTSFPPSPSFFLALLALVVLLMTIVQQGEHVASDFVY
jgi:hypothetical protein